MITPSAPATLTTLTLMSDDEVRSLTAGRRDDAGFGALDTARGPLPLIAMAIDARITGLLAGIELEQTFVNTTGGPIEATYIFPLPDRAAVTRFRMEVAGRIVEGVIEERGAAREQYDQAIATGHRAAITEEDRAGVFTMRVGNLMPGEAATVKLTLTGPLPIDQGEVTFQFPLVVAPRYMPGAGLGGPQAGTGHAPDTDAVPDASRISPPVLLPGQPNPVRLALRATIDAAGVPISGLASSLHAVSDAVKAGVTVVELRPGERLDRDFILRWKVGDNQVRSCVFCADDADGAGGTFVVTLVPPTVGVSQRPRDVAFVIDRSGSMEGWKMIAARRAVARMVDSLGAHDRFTVLAFDNTIETPVFATNPGELVAATDRNRFKAVEFLAGLAARGGTEMAEPLGRAAGLLAGGYDDRDRVLVLATDGQVGNEDQILRSLAPRLRNVRVFTLGIDQAVNAGFLRRLAGAGGGACELVESEDRLDAVMDKVHRRIGTPVVTELALAGDSLAVDAASVTPRRLPDLFVGAPVIIAGRYRGRAPARPSVWITGRSVAGGVAQERDPAGHWSGGSGSAVAGGGMREQLVARESLAGGDAAAVTAVWARGRVRDLEDLYITSGESPDVEREIVAVSKRFSVLSRFTAFLAIDRHEVVNPGGELRSVTQPVEMPSGWEMKKEDKSAVANGMLSRQRMAGPASPAPAPQPKPMQAQAFASAAPSAMDQGESGIPGGAPMSGGMGGGMGGKGYGAPRADDAKVAKQPRPEYQAAGSLPARPAAAAPPPPINAPVSKAIAPAAPSKTRAGGRSEPVTTEAERAIGLDDTPYRNRLGQIVATIESALGGPAGQLASALALALLRLNEWCEDARSVGLDHLAAAVTPIAEQLALAVRDDQARTTSATEAARRLRELATGATPPTAPTKSRLAFWK